MEGRVSKNIPVGEGAYSYFGCRSCGDFMLSTASDFHTRHSENVCTRRTGGSYNYARHLILIFKTKKI